MKFDTTQNKRIPFGIYESEFDANYYVILIKSMYFKEFALPYCACTGFFFI
jgi:hypothetical protein